MPGGLWLNEEYIPYSELDSETQEKLFRPLGGFCYEAGVFQNLPLQQIPFYLGGLLPKPGKALFYGRSKVGKSYFALQLARCIGSGLPFLGIPTQPGKVLYLQFELGESVLQQRMLATELDYHNVWVGTNFSMKIDTPAGKTALFDAVDAVRPNVVILDPLFKIISGDENNSHDVLMVLNTVDDLISVYQCSCVIIHHQGKDLSRASRGSSVLDDFPDATVELKRDKDILTITPKMLRHAETIEAIKARFEGGEFHLLEEGQIGDKSTALQVIREYCKGKTTVTTAELVSLSVVSRRRVAEKIEQLVTTGFLEKTGRGVYRVI